MNANQEKYDELENIIDTLRVLLKDVNDSYYKKAIEELIDEAVKELDEVSDELTQEHYEEFINEILEYEKGE